MRRLLRHLFGKDKEKKVGEAGAAPALIPVSGTTSNVAADKAQQKTTQTETSGRSAKTDREKYGLFDRHVPADGDPCSADIVAVHGLGGDWYETWNDTTGAEERIWLKDFIKEKFPETRVMSYGYDAAFALSSSVSDIHGAAASLLDLLDGKRLDDQSKQRPIIFIAHSLGGIIVKKAIILARERSDYYQNIAASTAGIMFFAVPHRGADLGYWANLATNALTFATLGAVGNSNFVKGLKRNSPEFAAISKSFIQPASKLTIIRSFFETEKIGNQLIVDEDSACLGLNNELAVPVPGADHRNICKFSDVNSQKYTKVQNALQKMLAGVATPHNYLIESLAKRCYESAMNEWRSILRDTPLPQEDLSWVCHMDQYCSWLESPKAALLCLEYEHTWPWQVSFADTFRKDFQARGHDVVWYMHNPEDLDCSSSRSSPTIDERGLDYLLPKSLIGQIISQEPSCVQLLNKSQMAMRLFADGWHIPIISGSSGSGKSVSWRTSLLSPKQYLWTLLAYLLSNLNRQFIVMIVGLDEETNLILQHGLEHLLDYSPKVSNLALNPMLQKILIISGNPSGVSFRCESQSLHIKMNIDFEIKECLASLYFPELHARRDRVEKSEHGTTEWIWTHPIYIHWKQAKSKLLWIYGKPGSGKSTLAAKMQRSLTASHVDSQFLTADFFYSKGLATGTSHVWMLRSILHQVLHQNPSLYPLYQMSFRKLRAQNQGTINWSFAELRKIILSLGTTRSLDQGTDEPEIRKFLFILDGVDESDGKASKKPGRHKALSLFSTLASTNSQHIFKVMILSRPEPDIRSALDTPYTIDMRSVNEPDVHLVVRVGMVHLWQVICSETGTQDSKYPQNFQSNTFYDSDNSSQGSLIRVTDNPELSSTRADSDPPPIDLIPEIPQLKKISSHIIENADGILLWVVMAIRELISLAKSMTTTVAQLNRRLLEIPNSLNKVYSDMIERIRHSPSKNEQLSRHVFAWLCFTDRPLQLGEVRDMMTMFEWTPDTIQPFQEFLNENRLGEYSKSWNPITTALANLCGGFVEILTSEEDELGRSHPFRAFLSSSQISANTQVHLVHTTAKEFLLLSPEAAFLKLTKTTSLDIISCSCLGYLPATFPQTKTLPQQLERKLNSWSSESRMQRFKLTNIEIETVLEVLEDRPLLFYILEQLPLHLEDTGWAKSSRLSAISTLFGYLSLANAEPSSHAWQILGIWTCELLQKHEKETIACVEQLRSGLSWKIIESLATGKYDCLEELQGQSSNVASLNNNPKAREARRLWLSQRYLTSCLVSACASGLAQSVRIILDLLGKLGKDPSFLSRGGGDNDEESPLFAAVSNGHHLVVRLLVQHGADVNANWAWVKMTPLRLAATKKHTLTVKELLKSLKVKIDTEVDSMTPEELRSFVGPRHPETIPPSVPIYPQKGSGTPSVQSTSSLKGSTLALAHLNFDFSLVRVEAPKEFHALGNILPRRRKEDAERGQLHRTARKLGALFAEVFPIEGTLLKAYGTRVSEISKKEKNVSEGTLQQGVFSSFAGGEGTSIWAAATSGMDALGVHLLACMLARIFTAPKATSAWMELVETRKEQIEAQIRDGTETTDFAAIASARIEITRDDISVWDSSARAWMQSADLVMSKQQSQVLLVADDTNLPTQGSNLYENVVLAMEHALVVMTRLLAGTPQESRSSSVLLAIMSWHLYPNMLLLNRGQTLIRQDDCLIPESGLLTVGMRATVEPRENSSWSLPLSYLRSHGMSAPTSQPGRVGLESTRISMDDFGYVLLGLTFLSWGPFASSLEQGLKWAIKILNALQSPQKRPEDSDAQIQMRDIMGEPSWIGQLLSAAQRYRLEKNEVKIRTALSLINLGRRRSKLFVPDAANPPPLFGLCKMSNLFPLLNDIEACIKYLRALSSDLRLSNRNCVIRYKYVADGMEIWEYATVSPIERRGGGDGSPGYVKRKCPSGFIIGMHARWLLFVVKKQVQCKCERPCLPPSFQISEGGCAQCRDSQNVAINTCRTLYGRSLGRRMRDIKSKGEICLAALSIPCEAGNGDEMLDFGCGSSFSSSMNEIYREYEINPGSIEHRIQLQVCGGAHEVAEILSIKPTVSQEERDWPENSPQEPLSVYDSLTPTSMEAAFDPRDFDYGRLIGWFKQAFASVELSSSQGYLRALKACASAAEIYQQLSDATITLAILNLPLATWKWIPEEEHIQFRLSTSRSQAYACIAMFETGRLNVEPKLLSDIFAISSGNSMFVSSCLLRDPLEECPRNSITRIAGNVGRPGLSFLVSVSKPKISSPDLDRWSLINWEKFTGTSEDSFPNTSMHMSFTSYEIPILGNPGKSNWEEPVRLLETVVSAYDRGKWIADLDVQKALESVNLSRFVQPSVTRGPTGSDELRCLHHGLEKGNADHRMVCADNWEELLEFPHGDSVVVFRAKDNWLARLAGAVVSIQQGRNAIILPGTMCWECLVVTLKTLKRPENSVLIM